MPETTPSQISILGYFLAHNAVSKPPPSQKKVEQKRHASPDAQLSIWSLKAVAASKKPFYELDILFAVTFPGEPHTKHNYPQPRTHINKVTCVDEHAG